MKSGFFHSILSIRMTTMVVLLWAAAGTGWSQSFDGLNSLQGYKLKVWFSPEAETQATAMATRCDHVMAYYKSLFDFEPNVTLLVLSPGDWSAFTDFPVYGMPHYNDEQTLIVASEDNDFWRSFIPPVDQLPADLAHQISATYADENHQLSMRAFFDLLAIHELGHAFHSQGGLKMQRKWMGELFANIFLHTYIAENEPGVLPALTIFPKMVVASTDKNDLSYTSLEELETNYTIIGQQYPKNYGWYQCRWHMAAATIYDQGGTLACQKLWTTLRQHTDPLDDRQFIAVLAGEVHQSVADVAIGWNP